MMAGSPTVVFRFPTWAVFQLTVATTFVTSQPARPTNTTALAATQKFLCELKVSPLCTEWSRQANKVIATMVIRPLDDPHMMIALQ